MSAARFGLVKIRMIRLEMSRDLFDRFVFAFAGRLAKFEIGI